MDVKQMSSNETVSYIKKSLSAAQFESISDTAGVFAISAVMLETPEPSASGFSHIELLLRASRELPDGFVPKGRYEGLPLVNLQDATRAIRNNYLDFAQQTLIVCGVI